MLTRVTLFLLLSAFCGEMHFCFGAITYVGSSTATCACGPSSTLTINVPAGIANNDLMISHITTRIASGNYGNYNDLPAPAGWTQIDMLVNPSAQLVTYIYYRIASSEPASYGFTDNTVPLYDRAGAIVAYRGVDTSDPFEAYAGQLTASGTSHTTPCALVNTTNSAIVTMFGIAPAAANTWTPPGGFTERVDITFTGSSTKSICCDDNLTSPAIGPTGGYTATSSSAGSGTACIFILRPSGQSNTYGTFFIGSTVDFAITDPLVMRKPFTVIQNDFMIAHLVFRATSGTPSAPAGWTLLRGMPDFANQTSTYIYYKIAGAAEPSTYTFTMNGINDFLGAIMAYRGINTATPIDVENGQTTASGTTHSTPSITTTAANDLLVELFGGSSSSSVNNWTVQTSTGWYEQYDGHNGQTSNKSLVCATVLKSTAGLVSAQTATATVASVGSAELVALKVSGAPIAGSGCGGINILPVNLISFTAHCENNNIVLKWETVSEVNNDHFEIQKSEDGIQWKTVGVVQGAGNSSSLLNYEFKEETIPSASFYYRLKQTDFNGSYEFFGPIAVKCFFDDWELILEEMPTRENLSAVLFLPHPTNLALSVVDTQGKIVLEESMDGEKGSNFFKVDLQKVRGGIYLMKVEAEDKVITRKFVKIF